MLTVFIGRIGPNIQETARKALVSATALLTRLTHPSLLSKSPARKRLTRTFGRLRRHPFHTGVNNVGGIHGRCRICVASSRNGMLFSSTGGTIKRSCSH